MGEPEPSAATAVVEPDVQPVRRVRACVFGLGGELFAVEVGSAREVVVLESSTDVPRAPAYVVGVTNLRGYVLPILDIRPLLGLSRCPVGPGTRVVVVAADPVQAAIVIDEVRGLASFDEIEPVPESTSRAHGAVGTAVLRDGQARVTLLDVARVLEALETRGKGV